MKFKAFTLAEMLITIGIIGFVSAMTIPSLISNVNDTRFRTQFLKTYTVIQQALKRMEADDIVIKSKFYDRERNPFYRTFLSYLTNSTDCGDCCAFAKNPMPTGCFDYNKNSYLSFRGNGTVDNKLFDDGQILMPGGSLVIVEQPLYRGAEKDQRTYKLRRNRRNYDYGNERARLSSALSRFVRPRQMEQRRKMRFEFFARQMLPRSRYYVLA